jgi:heme-degrading monooxygenase HmoA
MRQYSFGFSMRKFLRPVQQEDTEPIIFKTLWQSEWSPDFEELQRHRLVQGALRYGRINAPGKKSWDRPSDIIKRIKKYRQDHNLEHLVDAANLCMLEFEEGRHPDRHFRSQDNTPHTKKLR